MADLAGQLENATTNPSPRIEVYLPEAAKQMSTALVIFPGGGYAHLAEHEGRGYAEYFQEQGIACFVVTYRLGTDGHRHPAMLEDALAAVSTVRRAANELGVDPGRIGVMGSSAGGHLAAHALVSYDSVESSGSTRPDFGVLCYPVIDIVGEYCNTGSRLNLLGEDPSTELMHEVCVSKHVTAATPPCFLWHTAEDEAVPVENSMLFASALRKHGVPFELHVYEKGGHGLGLNAEFAWGADCKRWIRGFAVT